jgi:hypothetical protein
MIEPEEAQALARRLLDASSTRWRHVQAVAARAVTVASMLANVDGRALVSAAWLHDVGYAEGLVRSGFHHLDGAEYLRDRREFRLAGLVAYHSAGSEEAELRGLAGRLADFEDEATSASRALTFCDLTTKSDGCYVTLDQRVADVRGRYSSEHVVARSLFMALPRLTSLVANLEAHLAMADPSVTR